MSSSFVHAPRVEFGGSAVDAWLRANWDVATLSGSELIAVHDGSRHPVKECAVVFRNFRPVTGTPGAYFADPIAVVQYRSAMLTAIEAPGKYDHPVVKQWDVLVPLGVPDWGNAQTRIVLQQSARQWVSGARNTADMSDEHVITLYYSALQQLVFNAGNATTREEQARWFPTVVALTRAFSVLHAEYETARKVTTALVMTPGANDMLQKALAHVFHPRAPWDDATRLEILATVIRRTVRYAGASLVGMAPGPFALFTLVPLLRKVAHDATDVLTDASDLLAEFNSVAGTLLSDFTTDIAVTDASTSARNARLLASLSRAMGTPMTTEQASRLLAHCTSTDASATPDWAGLGLLPAPPVLTPAVGTERYAIGGRGSTYHVKITPLASDHFTAISYKGVEWSAIAFKTPGLYRVLAHDLGIATRGVGNTRGAELTANWRITAGDDILPRAREGYSLAGEHHVRALHGSWSYRHSAPLSLEKPCEVYVTPTHVALKQDGKTFFTMAKAGREPALFAFKNLWLEVRYTAPPTPTAPVAPVATPVSSGRSYASIAAGTGATPAARLATLRAVHAT